MIKSESKLPFPLLAPSNDSCMMILPSEIIDRYFVQVCDIDGDACTARDTEFVVSHVHGAVWCPADYKVAQHNLIYTTAQTQHLKHVAAKERERLLFANRVWEYMNEYSVCKLQVFFPVPMMPTLLSKPWLWQVW